MICWGKDVRGGEINIYIFVIDMLIIGIVFVIWLVEEKIIKEIILENYYVMLLDFLLIVRINLLIYMLYI